jgi:hypothetical protein
MSTDDILSLMHAHPSASPQELARRLMDADGALTEEECRALVAAALASRGTAEQLAVERALASPAGLQAAFGVGAVTAG